MLAEISGSNWVDIVLILAILGGYVVYRLTGGSKLDDPWMCDDDAKTETKNNRDAVQ